MADFSSFRSPLERAEVHSTWLNDFYDDDSRLLYESAFDHIAQLLGAGTNSTVLDAGCGSGSHTIRLASRGYPVLAMDVSEYILDRARANVAARNLSRMVTFAHGTVSSLAMPDGSFDAVLCWNVLMLIPEIDKAIAELCRVVRPGGFLFICEDNMWSFEALLVRTVRKGLGLAGFKSANGKYLAPPKISAAGVEYLHSTDAGPLFGRVARISWLIAEVGGHGFELKERIAFELLDSHIVPGKFLKRCVPVFNHFWFKHVRLPHPAMGNLLIFQNRESPDALNELQCIQHQRTAQTPPAP